MNASAKPEQPLSLPRTVAQDIDAGDNLLAQCETWLSLTDEVANEMTLRRIQIALAYYRAAEVKLLASSVRAKAGLL